MNTTHQTVHQIMSHTNIGKEMRLTMHIEAFDMDEVILDLGSEVNVLTKKTWE